jgi:hypothetical protein
LVSFMMHRRVGNLTQCANSLPRNEQIYMLAPQKENTRERNIVLKMAGKQAVSPESRQEATYESNDTCVGM